jgi:hypothetical protein
MFLPRAATYLGVIQSEELINTWIEQIKGQGVLVLDSPRTESIYAVDPNNPDDLRIYDREGIVTSAPQWLPTVPQQPEGDNPE